MERTMEFEAATTDLSRSLPNRIYSTVDSPNQGLQLDHLHQMGSEIVSYCRTPTVAGSIRGGFGDCSWSCGFG